ncbi:hypothetical protein H8D36_01295 [archaeon]|nr:hypothetical protein [archaeon]MBL7057147.1 hypothetical protein [Candidatus Woesearchaeota archaeon]
MSAKKKIVKCPGRFSGLREYLYEDVADLVLEGRSTVTENDLKEIWSLMQNDVYSFDQRDPYYESTTDISRQKPNLDYLSLVPLFDSTMHVDEALFKNYLLSMGIQDETGDFLTKMSEQPGRFFHSVLKRDSSDIILPGGKRLTDYRISANTGIGTLVSGGVAGGGIRSDSPFIMEIYHIDANREQGLTAVIGFWAQNNQMLVSQMQLSKNGSLPKNVPVGITLLKVAEIAAREMGIKELTTYSARAHPIFKEHPDNWNQMGKDFVCLYDNSARKSGFKSSNGRTGYYMKQVL